MLSPKSLLFSCHPVNRLVLLRKTKNIFSHYCPPIFLKIATLVKYERIITKLCHFKDLALLFCSHMQNIPYFHFRNFRSNSCFLYHHKSPLSFICCVYSLLLNLT